MQKNNITNKYKEKKEAKSFSDGYIKFIKENKIEQDCVKSIIKIAEEKGYKEWFKNNEGEILNGKFYVNNNDKGCLLFKIKDSIIEDKKMRIIASHIDSPRLDLKPVPLYEDGEFAYFKSHYYGGIKKHQYTCIPLEMKGRIYCENGNVIDCGETFKGKTFVISEIPKHLSDEQNKREYKDGVKGEELNIIVGGEQAPDYFKNQVKGNIIKVLEKYGIKEEDLSTADIEFVPKNEPQYIGFDETLIAGYGQDDKVCAYTSLMAELDSDKFSTFTIFADKEEIGSESVSGMQSDWWYGILEDICEKIKINVRELCRNSLCMSADVDGACDPSWIDAFDTKNSVRMNYGLTIKRCPASLGKFDANDGNAKQLREIVNIFCENKVKYQYGEFGKIDISGGGTISMYIARKNINCIDVGVPLLSMHSPYEITSMFDVYETYKGYKAFYSSK